LATVLEVDRVIAITDSGGGTYRMIVAPPVVGREPSAAALTTVEVVPAALSAVSPETPVREEKKRSWYQTPAFFVGVGALVVAAVATGFAVSSSGGTSSRNSGTLTVTSP
jgi:hypothetical protein